MVFLWVVVCCILSRLEVEVEEKNGPQCNYVWAVVADINRLQLSQESSADIYHHKTVQSSGHSEDSGLICWWYKGSGIVFQHRTISIVNSKKNILLSNKYFVTIVSSPYKIKSLWKRFSYLDGIENENEVLNVESVNTKSRYSRNRQSGLGQLHDKTSKLFYFSDFVNNSCSLSFKIYFSKY